MKIIILILAIFLISSCSTVSGDWSKCRKTDSKMGCVSISKADKLSSNQGEKLIKDNNDYTKILQDIDSWDRPLIEEYFISDDKSMIRKNEQIGRLWIAPYIDQNQNYHESSYVRLIDQPSKWFILNKKQSE